MLTYCQRCVTLQEAKAKAKQKRHSLKKKNHVFYALGRDMMTTVRFCSSAQPCAIMETSKNIEMKKKYIEPKIVQNGQTLTSFSGKK